MLEPEQFVEFCESRNLSPAHIDAELEGMPIPSEWFEMNGDEICKDLVQ